MTYFTNGIKNQRDPCIAGILFSADILSHQTLGDAKTSCYGRYIQLRMSHKHLIELCRFFFVKETLKTQIFIYILPMKPIFISLIVSPLFRCGISQAWIVREFLTCLLSTGRSYPYGIICKPNLLNLLNNNLRSLFRVIKKHVPVLRNYLFVVFQNRLNHLQFRRFETMVVDQRNWQNIKFRHSTTLFHMNMNGRMVITIKPESVSK